MARELPDHYQALGVGRDASRAELRGAYLKRVLASHPDKGGSSEEFHAVLAAFELLADLQGLQMVTSPSARGVDFSVFHVSGLAAPFTCRHHWGGVYRQVYRRG